MNNYAIVCPRCLAFPEIGHRYFIYGAGNGTVADYGTQIFIQGARAWSQSSAHPVCLSGVFPLKTVVMVPSFLKHHYNFLLTKAGLCRCLANAIIAFYQLAIQDLFYRLAR